MVQSYWWVGWSAAACLLAGCSGEGLLESEEAGEVQQAVEVHTACEGMATPPPRAGRYQSLTVMAGTDTTIREEFPDRNYRNEPRCIASFGLAEVCLVRFPLDALPQDAQIHYAQFAARLKASPPARFTAHTMAARWTEFGATWNSYKTGSPWTFPGARSDTIDDGPFCTFTTDFARVTYDLSGFAVSHIQDWVSGRAENSGIGFFADAKTEGTRLSMVSTEAQPADAPELTVWYTEKPVASQTVTLSAVASTTIDSERPSTNFSNQAGCEVARDGTREKACLLRWDASQIPPGSLVTRVVMTFGAPPVSQQTRWDLYPLRRSWVESQATWNVFATGSSWQIAGALGANDTSRTVGYLFPPTTGSELDAGSAAYALVQSWVDDPQANLGALFAPSRTSRVKASPWELSLVRLKVTFTPP